jgi:hypothetical protein
VHPVAELTDPDWGDKVNSMSEFTLAPSHGSMNSATDVTVGTIGMLVEHSWPQGKKIVNFSSCIYRKSG